MKIYNWLIILFSAISIVPKAQKASPLKDTSYYDPLDYYSPSFNSYRGSQFRSPNGSPGPQYWQNSADYIIHATLSEKDTTVSGNVNISYTNNSPDEMDFLWLQLDQNLFNPSSLGAVSNSYPTDPYHVKGLKTGGYHIGNVSITYHGKTCRVQPIISDTRMQLRLANKFKGKGDNIKIQVDFSFAIPDNGSDRMGKMNSKNGEIYQVAQWYPRMCVYDDVEGWNTLPYMGLGEFYCDYGNFDYYITAPSNLIVYGSGDLQNPKQVLTRLEIKRLAQAAGSDVPIAIVQKNEVATPAMRPPAGKDLTWHFKMKHSRDVAWAASKALIWEAVKVNVPSGRKVMAMTAYPVESIGDTAWSRASEYLKSSMEIYSKDLFEYPWNNAVNIAGQTDGMEYPGMIFCDYKEKRALLWDLITHEIGHNWFPMIVGSNERRYMWQDEGFNTYINDNASGIFNHGEYAKDTNLLKSIGLDIDALPGRIHPLMTMPEATGVDEVIDYYNKTSAGLKLLRYIILGNERFDYAFRKYTEAWAFKHPTPYDFFNFINNACGEDLNWFWKEWFFTTWTLDQAIGGVKYVDNDPAKGSLITIVNKGKLIMPVILSVTQANGTIEKIQLPFQVWQRYGTHTFRYPSISKLTRITLDPDKALPDINRKNNEWNGK